MLTRPTVAIVNNEPTFRWTISRLLEARLFAVDSFERGPAAIDRIRATRPEAVILEATYGSAVSATAIVERLRADRETHYTPIIVCSPDGKFLHSYGEYLRGQGCVVIGRPFSSEQFVELVERAVMVQTPPAHGRHDELTHQHGW
jgi:DNA-binding NtrC family response regulator